DLACFLFFCLLRSPSIHTLSLHDALPISVTGDLPGEDFGVRRQVGVETASVPVRRKRRRAPTATHLVETERVPGVRIMRLTSYRDRKSTRLNSSHQIISYAVFCLKKKNSN